MRTTAFVAVLAILAWVDSHGASSSVGLPVQIAKTRPCGNDDVRNVVIQVLRPGVIKINNQDVTPRDLEQRLEEIFKTRVYRFVFVTGDYDLRFGEVAAVIDRAYGQVDHVSIVTPSVLTKGQSEGWKNICLDVNLPSSYLRNPPRH